jgi:hypothetical protein
MFKGDSMIVNKIVLGHVIQEFDTDTEQFISQEFIGSDDTSYESTEGDPILGCQLPEGIKEYLPVEMKQPDETSAEEKLREIEEVLANSKDMTSLCKDILDILNTNC